MAKNLLANVFIHPRTRNRDAHVIPIFSFRKAVSHFIAGNDSGAQSKGSRFAHGVPRIDAEIQKHLVQLTGISQYVRDTRSRSAVIVIVLGMVLLAL